MRRALLTAWPALTRYYGLRPWDIGRLTGDEVNEYLRQYAHVAREQKQANDAARRAARRRRR